MTERISLSKRLLAGVGAFALAAAGLMGVGVANADDAPAPISVGNINPEADASLIIHKFDGDQGDPGDGTELPSTSGLGNPLSGVEFTIWRVTHDGAPIDLTTYEGWVLAKDATPSNVRPGAGGYGLEATAAGVVTTVDGVATFEADDLGLYFVEETDPGSNLIVSPVNPFLVSLPYPSGGDWLYDVHVYPKNKVDTDEPTKQVADPGSALVVGDEVTWTITKTLPDLATGGSFTKFIITDELDPRLSITADDITLTHADETLVQDDHYTVTITGQVVVITVTGALSDLESGEDVVATLVTTVEQLGEDEFANTALVNVNDAEQETNEPKVYWGSLELTKVDKDNAKTLAGAEFKLFASDKATEIVTVPSPLVTDENGEIVVNGLWVGTIASDTREYCLLETKAPAGYITPTGEAAWTCFTVTADGLTAVEKTVDNEKRQGPELPLTGAMGTAVFGGAGLAMLVIAAAAGVMVRRRQTTN